MLLKIYVDKMMLVLLRYSFQNESICNNAESKVARRKTHPYQPITFTNTGMKLLTHADYHLSLSLSLSLSLCAVLCRLCGRFVVSFIMSLG